jgi:hypothetical protein
MGTFPPALTLFKDSLFSEKGVCRDAGRKGEKGFI